MDPVFRDVVEQLHGKFERLLACPPQRFGALSRPLPNRAIYLFSESATHLYVGRTNDLPGRLGNHCRPTARDNQATFAFLMARRDTGFEKATYTKEGSRAWLQQHPEFATAFDAAKRRVRAMDIRFIEEPDPIRQALLEIYVATVLKTPYNDFENH